MDGRTGTVTGTAWLWISAVIFVARGQNYVNVALGKTYSQSSKLSAQDSSGGAANDDTGGEYISGTNCIHTAENGDLNPWWQADLGRTYPLHSVTIWARANYHNRLYPTNITVDGQLCGQVSYIPLDSRNQTVTCPSVLYGRTVRVTRQAIEEEHNADRSLALCELLIWVPSNVSQCEAGRYGASCHINCSDHCGEGPGKNFCYQSSGYCYDRCVAGWYGDQCSTACSPGCQNTACDRQSGRCSPCKVPYTGDSCSECVAGWYGDQCSKACSPGCQNVTCDRQAGYCSPCEPGYAGDTCSECQEGHYNDSSGTCVPCSENCQAQSCGQDTGKCHGCVDGRHGDTCSSLCQTVKCVRCDQDTGQCTECEQDSNLQTPHCTVAECDDGQWGSQCAGTCGQCQEGAVCDKTSGHCPLCEAGWYPPMCATPCQDGQYGVNCSHRCGQCPNDAACNTTTGLCPCVGGEQQCTSAGTVDKLTDDTAEISVMNTTVLASGIYLCACAVVLGVTLWVLKFGKRLFQTRNAAKDTLSA